MKIIILAFAFFACFIIFLSSYIIIRKANADFKKPIKKGTFTVVSVGDTEEYKLTEAEFKKFLNDVSIYSFQENYNGFNVEITVSQKRSNLYVRIVWKKNGYKKHEVIVMRHSKTIKDWKFYKKYTVIDSFKKLFNTVIKKIFK